jgi:hypothetical protein
MSNALKEQKPQRLLNNALAFYEAGRRCATLSNASFPPHKEAALYAPAVVCQAFAIEQFLKLLLLLETGGYPLTIRGSRSSRRSGLLARAAEASLAA